MAMSADRTWTCDRCGIQEQTTLDKQPAGWGAALTWAPPLMDPTESIDRDNPRRHLCRNCLIDVRILITDMPARTQEAAGWH